MFGIPAKKSRDRLDNGLLIDVPGIPITLIRKELSLEIRAVRALGG
jgi:hypothetical protein